jgi:hypothetical protein
MGKLLLVLSFVSLVFLAIGTAQEPNNAIFWLASPAHDLQQLRVILAAILGLEIVTRPPRKLWFRTLAGLVGLSVGIWTIQQTFSYHLELLDSLAFLAASVAVFVTAVERKALKIRVVTE